MSSGSIRFAISAAFAGLRQLIREQQAAVVKGTSRARRLLEPVSFG
jgi:hypothetical protein